MSKRPGVEVLPSEGAEGNRTTNLAVHAVAANAANVNENAQRPEKSQATAIVSTERLSQV